MGKTKIEWTDETWNVTGGCTPVSAGCLNCAAARSARRCIGLGNDKYKGLVKGPKWTGEIRLYPDELEKPLHWKRGRMVFVDFMSDLFHPDVPFEFIDKVWAVMALCPGHTFQILTKRPERLAEYLNFLTGEAEPGPGGYPIQDHFSDVFLGSKYYMEKALALEREDDKWNHDGETQTPGYDAFYNKIIKKIEAITWPLPNVWLGTTLEHPDYKHRLDDLRKCPAALRFISGEPLLADPGELDLAGIGWVICGGESGPGARPMHPDWARSVRDQCKAAGVPFFFKQWGAWLPWGQKNKNGGRQTDSDYVRVGKKKAGSLLDGAQHKEMPI